MADLIGSNQLVTDLASLDRLRKGAQQNDDQALLETARQFESLFVRELIKSMREANAVFEEDSIFNSNATHFYRDMQDQQMAMELSGKGGLGLAEVIAAQLKPGGNLMPASVLRGGNAVSSVPLSRDAKPAAAEAQSQSGAKEPTPSKARADIRFEGPEDFVEKLMPYARQAARALGLSPAVMLAQAALETGWGQKMLQGEDGKPSHNLFNIKAGGSWQGDRVKVSTLEYRGDQARMEKALFRVYRHPVESFKDFVSLLKNSDRYQEALGAAKEPARFLQKLQEAGYATDPNYASKIMKVLAHPALTRGAD
ncbi:flagellar assembly peptidoglycan hydrolase FlgJ [Gallaecimonas sp. GXIMD4217]|uniref:flagellar assembly peptidoglycan hydrolase FlgJ n=1 Tax=Gallaecimonas sp. GXIMD4217 TaxID=3131927 RepID=UPI00311B162D